MNHRVTSSWTGVVLCAGLGTRLRPLTDFVPKPLLPIVDTPMAQFAAQRLVEAGATRLELNAFHLAPQVEAFAHVLAREFDVPVQYHLESQLLGTAGGVAAMAGERSTLVVWNGDIFAPDLSLDWVNESAIEFPTLVVSEARKKGLGPDAGTVGLDTNGQVVRLRGERFGTEVSSADYIGVAVLPRAFTALLPRVGCLVADALLPWLRAGKPVRAQLFEGYWSDGGTLHDYLLQNVYWLRRTGREHYVGDGAECAAPVLLHEAVIGPGARVVGAGQVQRTLVLPGAYATAPLSDAIVAPNGQVLGLRQGAA